MISDKRLNQIKAQIETANALGISNLSTKGVLLKENPTTYEIMQSIAGVGGDTGNMTPPVASAKEEQEKTIDITENGTTEVVPDDGKVLSKVTVNVDVSGGSVLIDENGIVTFVNTSVDENGIVTL